MAIAVDATTPVRWTGQSTSGLSITSAAFTAPADALLVACCSNDSTAVNEVTGAISDSGGLVWTQRALRSALETTAGGYSAIYTARTTSAVSRTVTWNPTWGTADSFRKSVKLYVLTGVDVDGTPVDTVGASNEGGSTTNNLTTTSITPGANGLLIVCDTDWQQRGTITSTDLTIDPGDYATQISVASGYKTCTSGVGVTGNLDAGGSSAAQHKWCQIIVREVATATTAAYVPAFRFVGPRRDARKRRPC